MFELCGILFLDWYSKQNFNKPRLKYIEKRKAEYQRFRDGWKQGQMQRAAKMRLANDIHMYKHGKPLFDPELKRIRAMCGDKFADEMIARIEEAEPTNFDTIKYM